MDMAGAPFLFIPLIGFFVASLLKNISLKLLGKPNLKFIPKLLITIFAFLAYLLIGAMVSIFSAYISCSSPDSSEFCGIVIFYYAFIWIIAGITFWFILGLFYDEKYSKKGMFIGLFLWIPFELLLLSYTLVPEMSKTALVLSGPIVFPLVGALIGYLLGKKH